jgi:hypothetical protein
MKVFDLISCPKKCGDCMLLTYLRCAARHRNPEYYQPWSLEREMYP